MPPGTCCSGCCLGCGWKESCEFGETERLPAADPSFTVLSQLEESKRTVPRIFTIEHLCADSSTELGSQPLPCTSGANERQLWGPEYKR